MRLRNGGTGGCQFVGRTIQMWNRFRHTESFEPGKPWLLRFFDQIQYYPVEADELLKLREDFLRGKFEADITETTFKLRDYLEFRESIKHSAEGFKSHQQTSFNEERERWREQGLSEYISEQEAPAQQEEDLPEGAIAVSCSIPGNVWKVMVTEDQKFQKEIHL